MPNYGPIPKLEGYLEDAVKTNYWFYAIVFSAIEVEKYGCDKIRSHMTSLILLAIIIWKGLEFYFPFPHAFFLAVFAGAVGGNDSRIRPEQRKISIS